MFNIQPEILMTYAVAFLRIGAILFALPIFGDAPVPIRTRLMLAAALTGVVAPTLASGWAQVPNDPIGYLPLILREISIGLVIGFTSKIIFEGVVMAASVVGFQMGFGAANLFIPDAGQQMNSFTALHRLIVMLIFFSLNLHHLFISGIIETFRTIPAGAAIIGPNLVELLSDLTASIFQIGIQLAAPVLISLIFTMAALGLMARTVPQLNVFALSFPISLFVGMVIYAATLPLYPTWLQERFLEGYDKTLTAIRQMY